MSTPSPNTPARTSITDSPWYWLYLFCTAGLIALVLVGPKYAFRQSQVERSGQGRQRAVQNTSGRDPTVKMSDVDDNQIPLRPLYVILAILLAFAWFKLAWSSISRRRQIGMSTPPTADALPNVEVAANFSSKQRS